MKRNLITITFFILILCFACKKQESIDTSELSIPHSATFLSDSKGYKFGVSTKVGHPGSSCDGCVQTGGAHFHVECQGPGSDCTVKAVMELSDSGEINFYLGTIDDPDELTIEDIFFMPDRSLYIIGSDGQFLNIPKQVVYRDEETGAFVFIDIFFSDSQAFENK